jgi:hypothetical protein
MERKGDRANMQKTGVVSKKALSEVVGNIKMSIN